MWNAGGSSSHRHRCQQYGGEYRPLNRRRVFERDGYRCHICGCKTNPHAKYPSPNRPTIDCIIPLSKGGSYTYENTATACARCNFAKKNRAVDGDQLMLVG